ncbi:MAG TPA: cyclic nucleotide-binding domain-containing protein [Aliidiomarina sp.]|nr:cyclic nucleotide-binding domain-containing protein [Aliidiomarina sp.]
MKTKAVSNITELRAVELLNRTLLFKALTAEEKRMFAEIKGIFRLAKAGAMFIEQGHADYSIYVIMSGEAEVHKDGVLVGQVAAGQFVGEVSFVTRERRTASVLAVTDMILLRIDAESFRRLPIQAREIVKDKMIEGLHHRVERMNAEIIKFRHLLAAKNAELPEVGNENDLML